jgi:parallel beta-helix repeat protein
MKTLKKKTGTMFAILLIAAIFSSVQLAKSQTEQELYYDDGAPEGSFYFTEPGGIAAVRFTPQTTGKLMRCRFNIWNTTTAKIHVMDANRNDLITPFSITPTTDMWTSVDLSGYGIIVIAGVDFYIGIEWVTGYTSINYDTNSPDYRSWYYLNGWFQFTEGDYLIRATIETGGEEDITYILRDGTVWGGAPILRNGDYYILYADYYGRIIVQRDNITLDGAGYWLRGLRVFNSSGIFLYGKYNVTVKNFRVTEFYYGICLLFCWYCYVYNNTAIGNTEIGIAVVASNVTPSSGYNTIAENNAMKNDRSGIQLHYDSDNKLITNNATENGRSGIELEVSHRNSITRNNAMTNDQYGIELFSSNSNTITGNNVTMNYVGIGAYLSLSNTIYKNSLAKNNYDGIRAYSCSFNNVIANNITENNRYGVYFRDSSDNTVYHNNFVANVVKQAFCNNAKNVWDNGYPSGGNYWSDYPPSQEDLYYDDDSSEEQWSWVDPGGMYAVRFTPSTAARLIACSYYIVSVPTIVKIHVMDESRNDLITPFLTTPVSTGWCGVDLSFYWLIVDKDFYIGVEVTVGYSSYLGTDTSSPDGRSWDWNRVEWTQRFDRDYMITCIVLDELDTKSGPNQDLPGSDGIGDAPYVIDSNNMDRYPLVKNWTPIVGDVNGDGRVSLADLVLVAWAYGSRPGNPNWNPDADIDSNGVVGLNDLVLLALNYGRQSP